MPETSVAAVSMPRETPTYRLNTQSGLWSQSRNMGRESSICAAMSAEWRRVGRSSRSSEVVVARAVSIRDRVPPSWRLAASPKPRFAPECRCGTRCLAVGKRERGDAGRGKLVREIVARRVGLVNERGARQADLGRNRRNRGGGGPHEKRCRNGERGERRQKGAEEHLLNRFHGGFPLRAGRTLWLEKFRCGWPGFADLSRAYRPPNGLSGNFVDVSPLDGGQCRVDSFLTLCYPSGRR